MSSSASASRLGLAPPLAYPYARGGAVPPPVIGGGTRLPVPSASRTGVLALARDRVASLQAGRMAAAPGGADFWSPTSLTLWLGAATAANEGSAPPSSATSAPVPAPAPATGQPLSTPPSSTYSGVPTGVRAPAPAAPFQVLRFMMGVPQPPPLTAPENSAATAPTAAASLSFTSASSLAAAAQWHRLAAAPDVPLVAGAVSTVASLEAAAGEGVLAVARWQAAAALETGQAARALQTCRTVLLALSCDMEGEAASLPLPVTAALAYWLHMTAAALFSAGSWREAVALLQAISAAVWTDGSAACASSQASASPFVATWLSVNDGGAPSVAGSDDVSDLPEARAMSCLSAACNAAGRVAAASNCGGDGDALAVPQGGLSRALPAPHALTAIACANLLAAQMLTAAGYPAVAVQHMNSMRDIVRAVGACAMSEDTSDTAATPSPALPVWFESDLLPPPSDAVAWFTGLSLYHALRLTLAMGDLVAVTPLLSELAEVGGAWKEALAAAGVLASTLPDSPAAALGSSGPVIPPPSTAMEGAARAMCTLIVGQRALVESKLPLSRRVLECCVAMVCDVIAGGGGGGGGAGAGGMPLATLATLPEESVLLSLPTLLAAAVHMAAAAGARDGSGTSFSTPLVEALCRTDPPRFMRTTTVALLATLYDGSATGAFTGGPAKALLASVAAAYGLTHLEPVFARLQVAMPTPANAAPASRM